MSESDPEQKVGEPETNAAISPKPTLFQRWKAHMKKWWWTYVIVICCIVLVVVLPVVYVGVPHFTSQYINDYKYDYTGLYIRNPTPTSFHVRQVKNFEMGGGFSGSGHLSGFDASLSLPDTTSPFAVFPIQQIEFDNGANFDINQDLNISCVDCLSQLAADVASNKDISVLVTGNPDLKFGGLPTAQLDIHKKMKMRGYDVQKFLNSDNAFNVTSIDLLDSRSAEGYNVHATVAFQNPSPYNVDMGFVSFNLSVGDSSIGYVDIPSLKLQHNGSDTSVHGNINDSILIDEGLSGSGSFGEVKIGIHGNRCVYDGQEIPYFTAAIQAISASVKINLMDYASDIL